MNTKKNYMAGIALLALGTAGMQAQPLNTNGTNGGEWNDPATWELSAVPTETQNFHIVSGDTVTANNLGTIINQTTSLDPQIQGTLNLGGGTTIIARRLNSGIVSTGTLNINGGVLSVDRLAHTNTSNFTMNVNSGSLIVRGNSAAPAGYTLNIAGGLVDTYTTSWSNGIINLSGGTLLFSNTDNANGPASGLGAIDAGSWNGGTIALITEANIMTNGATTSLINNWSSNPSNVLLASTNDTIAQTLTLHSGNRTATQGILAFNIYSSANNDNDKLAQASSTLTLEGGVTLDIRGMDLPGSIGDYVGASYKFFELGNYASITPVVPNSTINVGGTDYEVSWNTSNLAIDGTLTLVPEPSTYALVTGLFLFAGVIIRRRSMAA